MRVRVWLDRGEWFNSHKKYHSIKKIINFALVFFKASYKKAILRVTRICKTYR